MTRFVVNEDFRNTSMMIIAQIRARVDANAPISLEEMRDDINAFDENTTDEEIEQACLDAGFRIVDG